MTGARLDRSDELAMAMATVGGVILSCQDVGPRREPLVVLHGIPETGDAFATAVAKLGRRGQPIVPDRRDAGSSQRRA